MGDTNYLIDTNAIIDFMASRLPEAGMSFISDLVDDIPKISVITQIELLGFDGPQQDMALLEDFIIHSEIYPLNNPVVDMCILLRKHYRIRLPDAIIAATAKVNSFHIITRNVKDFKNIKNLQIINPHEIGS